jgi:hypothetical protein
MVNGIISSRMQSPNFTATSCAGLHDYDTVAKQFPFHQSNDMTTNENHSQQLIPSESPLNIDVEYQNQGIHVTESQMVLSAIGHWTKSLTRFA